MDDFKRFRDIEDLIEQSWGISSLRATQKAVSALTESIRVPPYVSGLSKAILAAREAEDARLERFRAMLPVAGSTAIERIIADFTPYAMTSLRDSMASRLDVYNSYLSNIASVREGPAQILESLGRDFMKKSLLPGWAESSFVEDLQTISTSIRAMQPSSAAVVATAVEGWHSALFGNQAHAIAAVMANPLLDTVREIRKSSELLVRTDDALQARSAEWAIALLDLQLRTSEDIAVQFQPDNEVIVAPPRRRLLVPRTQRYELEHDTDAHEDADDPQLVLARVPSGQVVLLAYELLRVAAEINENHVNSKGTTVFKVTQRLFCVAAELPFVLVVDRRTLADFVDRLYWLLFEATGSKARRFHTSEGGPLSDEGCEIVFVIKRLRNHFRHDPEHGSERDIERKLEAVRADLKARGFHGLPRTREAYRQLQEILLTEAVNFVTALRSSL